LVARAVSEIKPEFKEDFNTAATSYKDKLAALDRYIHAATQTIPKENKVLVTAHDAFGYYGHAYDLEVIGIQGLSTASEAGLYKIEKLVNRISQQKIPAIFTETSVSDQNIRAIRDGVKANGHSVVIGASLYSDSLGAPDTLTGTYIGMMEHNTNVITKALGGTLPLKLQTKNKTAFAIPNE
jgi:manganese/zinc/iron transport system substrate-binding protein